MLLLFSQKPFRAMAHGAMLFLGACSVSACTTVKPSNEIIAKLDDEHWVGKWFTQRGFLEISCRGYITMEAISSRYDDAGKAPEFVIGNAAIPKVKSSAIVEMNRNYLKIDDGVLSAKIKVDEPPSTSGRTLSMKVEGRTYVLESAPDCREIF